MSTQSRGHATLGMDVLRKEIGVRMSTQSRGHATRRDYGEKDQTRSLFPNPEQGSEATNTFSGFFFFPA